MENEKKNSFWLNSFTKQSSSQIYLYWKIYNVYLLANEQLLFVYLHICINLCKINLNSNSEKNNSNEEIKLMHSKVYTNKRNCLLEDFSWDVFLSLYFKKYIFLELIEKAVETFCCEIDLNWKILQQTNLLYIL